MGLETNLCLDGRQDQSVLEHHKWLAKLIDILGQWFALFSAKKWISLKFKGNKR